MIAGIAAKQAMTQQAVALEVVKQQANVQQALANMIDQTARSVPAGSTGGTVNITA